MLQSLWQVSAIKTERHIFGEQQYEEERKNNA